MALVNTETGETFDAEFAASLERWLEQNIEVGITTVEAFEASEALKDVQDQIKQLMIIIALNKTTTTKPNKNVFRLSFFLSKAFLLSTAILNFITKLYQNRARKEN